MRRDEIIYPSFEAAQALYSNYSTIADNVSLQDSLLKYVDSSFLSTLHYSNIREIYNDILLEYYPNETCIKAEFINNILLKGKKHVSIFEFPIGNSRADLCKINGSSIAYEIKTDLDNFSRLRKQIQDYSSVFEYIYVVCSASKAHEITHFISDECGIYTYRINNRGNYHFDLKKKAIRNTQINPRTQLKLLQKKELFSCFTFNISEYQKSNIIEIILQAYSPFYINTLFKQILKKRYQKQWDFLKNNTDNILEIDYQWFFKNPINPSVIYN